MKLAGLARSALAILALLSFGGGAALAAGPRWHDRRGHAEHKGRVVHARALRHHRRGKEARLRCQYPRRRRLRQRGQGGQPGFQPHRPAREGDFLDSADPAGFNGVVRQAKAAKIPIIAAGSPTVATDVQPDAGATSSHCTIGHEFAVGVKKMLPNGGSIAILAGPPGAFWATDRLRCFKEDIAGTNIKIVAEQTSEQDVASAALASDLLQRFPNLDLLYGADDTYGVGIARAVQTAGKCGKVKVLFSVLGSAAEELMRAGCVDYVVAQQPAPWGGSRSGSPTSLSKAEARAADGAGAPYHRDACYPR